MQPAIRVENVSKRFHVDLAKPQARYRTLREDLSALARSSLGWWRSSKREEPSTDFWALKDVSFEVPHGEVVGVVGRNGAGKSTLLKMMSRITNPTGGRISIEGRVGS